MTNRNNDYMHLHELTEGTLIGDYRVVQHTSTGILAEHRKTGELIRLERSGDKLIYPNKH